MALNTFKCYYVRHHFTLKG